MAIRFNKANAKVIKSDFACQRDNLTIRGTEYRPKGNCLPIAVVCHGFMAFQDTVRQYAVALAEMGYVSYCFDFCGGGGRKREKRRQDNGDVRFNRGERFRGGHPICTGKRIQQSKRSPFNGMQPGRFCISNRGIKAKQYHIKISIVLSGPLYP